LAGERDSAQSINHLLRLLRKADVIL
jgi:hypothetical protein